MPPTLSETQARENLQQVQAAMAEACRLSGRALSEVTLVAVSKHQPPAAVAALAAAGQRLFGENYVQEGLAKQEALALLPGAPLVWHYIGRLQSNKCKYVAGRFDLIHTVDSLKLAHELHKQARKVGIRQPVLVQVNIGCEPQKAGVACESLEQLAEDVARCEAMDLPGLMCMPPWDLEAEATRPYFSNTRELRDRLRERLGLPLPHLSMGMSADFPQAIQEGATLIRVGTALFGAREPGKDAA